MTTLRSCARTCHSEPPVIPSAAKNLSLASEVLRPVWKGVFRTLQSSCSGDPLSFTPSPARDILFAAFDSCARSTGHGGAAEHRKRQNWVLLDPQVYVKIDRISRIKGVTIEEWVNETLRKAVLEAAEAMRQVIHEASKVNAPTADIDQMLKEIESGYNSL